MCLFWAVWPQAVGSCCWISAVAGCRLLALVAAEVLLLAVGCSRVAGSIRSQICGDTDLAYRLVDTQIFL